MNVSFGILYLKLVTNYICMDTFIKLFFQKIVLD